jgi:D-glycero-alpha-D-manno-heptose-7-phosphate kinase
MVFTGIKRKAADVVAKQLTRVEDNAATLEAMREMAYEGFRILTGRKSLDAFGELLHHAWQAKRSLDGGISSGEIDEIYETGRKAGALGGKLLGAGGGGFMLFYAPPKALPKLRRAFRDRRVLQIKLSAPGSQVIFS